MKRLDLAAKLTDVLAEALYELSELGSQIYKPSTYLKRYIAVPTELWAGTSLGYCLARAIYYPLEGILIVEVKEGESKTRWGNFISSYPDLLQQEVGTPHQVAALVEVIKKLSDRLREVLEAAWEGFTLDYRMVESIVHREEE